MAALGGAAHELFTGVMRYTHAKGDNPCGQIAFYGAAGVLDAPQPLAYSNGAIAVRVSAERPEVPCAACGRAVTRDDLAVDYAQLPQVYVAPERRQRSRGRGLRPLRDHHGPASLGHISAATGVPRKILREMCEAGEVKGAYRHHGKRREWRLEMKDARALIAKLTGADVVAA